MRISVARIRRAFARLSMRELLEIPYLLLLAVIAEIAVRVVGLEKLCRVSGMRLVTTDTSGRAAEEPSKLSDELASRVRGVRRAFKIWPSERACLRRSLVLGFRVRRWDPVLRLGAVRGADGVHAHAWVEVDGTPLDEGVTDVVPLRSAR